MTDQTLTSTIQAPWGGYDVTSPDNQLPANKCRKLVNFLSGRIGRVTLRGPLYRPTSTDSASALNATTLSGGWVFGDKLLHVDMRSNPVGYMVTDWSVTPPTLSAKVNPAGLNVGLYPFHVRTGNFVYGYTAGSAGAPSTLYPPNRRTPSGSATASDSLLMRWDGGAAVGNFSAYSATTMPRGAIDIKGFLNRLWVLGGSVPGTATPQFFDRLYYSIDLGDGTSALADAATSWQTAGFTNQIQLDGSASDYGVALALLNGRLIILRRQSTYMLTGTSPVNFQLRKIAGVGCLDPGSVLEWDDGVFFLSDIGLMFFDGVAIHQMSSPITEEIHEATTQGNVTVELSIARLGAEHFIMTSTIDPALFPQLQTKCWICHVPTQSWTQLTADTKVLDNSASGVPKRVMRVTNYPIVYDGTLMYDATYVPIPEVSDPAQAGHDTTKRLTLGSGDYIIPGTIVSRTVLLASPQRTSQLQYLFLEYILKSQPGQTLPPVVVISTDSGKLAPSSSTSQGLLGDNGTVDTVRKRPKRRTLRTRYNGTVTDLQLTWTIDKTTNVTGTWPLWCEVYDSTVLFIPGAFDQS